MKKLLIITSLLVTTVSCINEKNEALESAKVQAPSLYCYTENNPLTRTSLSVDEEGIGTIYWKPADCINVFFGTEKLRYYSTNEEVATNVKFDTTDGLNGASADFSNIWGLYPYDAAATSDGLSVITTIPASQQCIDNSFDTDLFPMLAHSASNELHFNNICGGIKFSLSRADIKRITFKGNNDEDIAGRVKVIMDGNGKPLASIESGEKVITLTPKSGETFNSGAYYYIVILPCSLTGGFTMTFETDEEIGTFNYNEKAISIKRSVFSKKENIDSYASFKVIIPDGVVDMGLSVMWATCNLGATTPEGYGDYYAWGETETKSKYTWANYKWCNGSSTSLTKYNSTSNTGIVDNKTTLDLEDDVAYVKLGGRWRMPSSSEMEELISNCTITAVTSNGVDGIQYTSKKNGNSIFVPKAGKRSTTYNDVGRAAYHWSSYRGVYLYGMYTPAMDRSLGVPVRPVFHSGEEYETPENPADGIIDLGLSIRWRSCNLGAASPEEYGGYYQWAGTSDISDNSIRVYNGTFPYGSYSSKKYYITKYNVGDCDGKTDNKSQLEKMDDAATVILGESWRTPTYEECQELIQNCSWTRICVNGVGGYKIQSNVDGFTDKWIFLPTAGVREEYGVTERTNYIMICEYWSSTLSKYSACAYAININNNAAAMANSVVRYYGLPIRPVTTSPPSGPVAITNISLNKTWASMRVGESRTLIASVEPDYATVTWTWASDNTSVATVDPSGKVTAIAEGTALITVKTEDGHFTASCTVKVRDIPSGAVDLDLPSGLLWASRNIGASSRSGYGNYYAWGEIETKSSYTDQNYRFHLGGHSAEPTYSKYVTYSDAGTVDNLTELQRGENPGETMDDVARAVLGGKWRMPRPEEFEELIKNTDNAYTEYNGVNGWMFTSKTDSDNWIFLPAAGYWGDSGKVLVGSLGVLLGNYWSSVCDGYWDGKGLGFHSPYKSETWVGLSSNYRWCGQPVRPVIEW